MSITNLSRRSASAAAKATSLSPANTRSSNKVIIIDITGA